MPYSIHQAITAALAFLSYDELAENERPPKKIWLDETRMKSWWDEVKRMREQAAKGEDESEMEQGSLADSLVVG